MMSFLPVLHDVPLFGPHAARTWLWTVDLSPGFLGQGIIIGPAICSHMLLGAIVGLGVLSPYAKHRSWAPGEVDDWSSGARGWIIWISLAALFADASIKLGCSVLKPVLTHFNANIFVRNSSGPLWKQLLHNPGPLSRRAKAEQT